MPSGYSFQMLSKRMTCGRNSSTQTSTPDFHLHNYYEMYLLLQGEVTFLIEDRRWQLGRGDIVLLNDREVHKSINPGGQMYTRYGLHFDPTLLSGFGGEGAANALLSLFDRSAGRPPILHLSEEVTNAAEEQFRAVDKALRLETLEGFIQAQAHLALLLCTLLPVQAAPLQEVRAHSFSDGVMEYLQAHPTEPFSLTRLEEVFSVNKHHLCRRFKQETGGTIYHYLLLKRIAMAQALLAKGESVSAAGEAAGFSDYANFIRSFKKQTGMSPGQYRKKFSA